MFCLRTCSDLKLADWRGGSHVCHSSQDIVIAVCVNYFWINDNMQKAWSVCLKTLQVTVLIKMFYIVTWVMDVVLDLKSWCYTILWHFSFWVQPPKGRLIRKLKSSFYLPFKKMFAKNSQNFVLGFILEDYICICSKQLVHTTKCQPSVKQVV